MEEDQRHDALKREKRILEAKLRLVIEQRNGFMENYHAVVKLPFAERGEVLNDCNEQLDQLEIKLMGT